MANLYKNLKKILIIFLFYNIFVCTTSKAELYEEIQVKGNDRLSVETIIMFAGINLSIDIEEKDLNSSIKNLFETNYFKDVKISINNKIIVIDVIENPIIQSIKISGVKNKAIESKLIEVTKKSEKYPFLESNIRKQKNLLLNIVRASGFTLLKLKLR